MIKVLENDLKNWCELQELEPDSKWINLSRIFVMRAMDRKAHCHDVIKSLETIQVQKLLMLRNAQFYLYFSTYIFPAEE